MDFIGDSKFIWIFIEFYIKYRDINDKIRT